MYTMAEGQDPEDWRSEDAPNRAEQQGYVIQGKVINYNRQEIPRKGEEFEKAQREEGNYRNWEKQLREQDTIMRLEGIVEKSQRQNEEMWKLMKE